LVGLFDLGESFEFPLFLRHIPDNTDVGCFAPRLIIAGKKSRHGAGMEMRFFGTGVIALVGLTATAFAADLSAPTVPTPKAPASAPAINWSGFYVGVNAGGDLYGGNGFVGGATFAL
jgi:hypothetical protein